MTYQETLNWMFSQLPMYQKKGKTAFKKDTTNILAFVDVLGNPHHKFKSIHVGGTNGKGSTSHMISSILQEAGYKVGLYTSPHLKNYTERIKINGKEISEVDVVSFIQSHKTFLERQQLSFFEMTVGLAFDYFAKQQVDIAIIEVGLGGRLDSTNIVKPQLSIITNIGYDHTQFLGDTLPKIAFEKAGIIKQNISIVIGERQTEVEDVFKEKAKETNSSIYFAEDYPCLFKSDLKGNYQINNIRTAVCSIKHLENFTVSDKNLIDGLLNVVNNTGFKGRWQVLSSNPYIVCDTAHNKEGLKYVINQIRNSNYDNLHIVLGVVSDKDLDTILPLFPKQATYYFCKPNIQRGLDTSLLCSKAQLYGLIGNSFLSVEEAFTTAKQQAGNNDMIFIGGSTFVVAEIL